MKKLFFTMLLCVISISVSAQEHLTFKGIPIDGSLTSFVEKLKVNGFKQDYVGSDSAIMKGDFGGNVCVIAIYATKISKKVHSIGVVVKESNSWYTLKSTYEEYKSSLTLKYGKGDSVEYFLSPYEAGDGYEMSALRRDKCIYRTKFETLKGDIMLAICDIEGGGNVILCYSDKANSELSKAEEKSLIGSDL